MDMSYYYKKRKKGKMYLYQGISEYRDGISVRVKSRYVGLYNDLSDYFQHADIAIQYQDHFELGLSQAIFELTHSLGMPQILQHHIQKKFADPFLNLRIIMMVINRLVSPCAKYSIEKWYARTNLCNTLDLPSTELESQKIYRAMDKLDESSEEIEKAFCKVIGIQENISYGRLYLDFTNQESYSRNHDSELLNYGHNKRGKDELYQINISLCCDVETGIPFFHKSYPGNFNDKQFIHGYAKELRARLLDVGWKERTMLIIDRGINGKDNFDLLLENQFDYLGGLIEREFPQYFEIPKSSLVKRYSHKRKDPKPALKIRYLSKKDMVYGREHKVLIFYNQENYDEKVEQLNLELSNYEKACVARLSEFKQEIKEKTFQSSWNNTEKITKQLQEINKHLFQLLKFKIKSYRFELSWSIVKNERAIHQYIDKFGKHVLFTNLTDLPDKDILELFFNKDKIEKNFEFLKSNAYTNRFIVLGPMLHSKDERITSHVYTCIMALQLYQLIRNRLKSANVHLSVQEALEELEGIFCYYTKIVGKKEVIRHVNPRTDNQKKILRALQANVF